MFDFIVVDTSGVFDDNALTALDRTDTIVLVATLDIPALKGLKLATGTLDLLNFGRDTWKFVLNRADGKVGPHRRTSSSRPSASRPTPRWSPAARCWPRSTAVKPWSGPTPPTPTARRSSHFAKTFVDADDTGSGKQGLRRTLRLRRALT